MKSKKGKSIFRIALIVAAMGITALSAQAKQPKSVQQIEIIGKTADGKYPVYNLKGDIDDTKFFSNGRSYTAPDLLTRMTFIDEADAKSGKYACSWICKDRLQNVVGLNPSTKGFLKK